MGFVDTLCSRNESDIVQCGCLYLFDMKKRLVLPHRFHQYLLHKVLKEFQSLYYMHYSHLYFQQLNLNPHHRLYQLGAMLEFQKQGMKIPEDIACMGFSNWKLDQLVSPTLSSVEQNGFLMGIKVFETFIKDQHKKKGNKVFYTEIIPTKIVIRESTARGTKT